MKKAGFVLLVFVIFASMLLFPEAVITGASQGLLLWFEVLIPTLLPFLMISRLLIRTHLVHLLARILYPVFGRLFGTTPEGTYCILIGFLCGYPMGAKAIADLYRERTFSRAQAEYLLSFCNNVSPGFLTGFVVCSCLMRTDLLMPVLLLVYGVPLTGSFLIRLLIHTAADEQRRTASSSAASTGRTAFTSSLPADIQFADLDDMIRSSLASIGMLGGYVILFRILTQFLLIAPFPFSSAKKILAGVLEITSGLPILTASTSVSAQTFALVIACTVFGGLCGIAQTAGMTRGCGFSMPRYILARLLEALSAGFLAYVFYSIYSISSVG